MAGNRYNIESFIHQHEGTFIGQSVKNMYENETDFESICEHADIEYDPEDEDVNDGVYKYYDI